MCGLVCRILFQFDSLCDIIQNDGTMLTCWVIIISFYANGILNYGYHYAIACRPTEMAKSPFKSSGCNEEISIGHFSCEPFFMFNARNRFCAIEIDMRVYSCESFV